MALVSYLTMSAQGDLKNALKRNEKYRLQLHITEFVELEERYREYSIEPRSAVNVEQEAEIRLSPTWADLQKLLPAPVDQEIIFLLMCGIRETYWYANALGILDKPIEEQRKIVKRNKDRIKKTILRNIDPENLKK